MVTIDQLMDLAYEKDASDIHLIAGERPVLRIYGRLYRLQQYEVLTPADTERLVRSICPDRNWEELQTDRSTDFGVSHQNKARFRVAAYWQKNTLAMNLRLIPYKMLSFEDLGLGREVIDLLYEPRGLILITGPTGSGKTTTLATMIDWINTHRDCHIITIEDPIEYYHSPKKSIISQREVGVDVPTFADGVVRALREDPDVILVGEMRDLRTIQAAITAAETGHLVFSTLHTTGAAKTVDRITDVFPLDQQEQIRVQLSTNLVAVISQQLLPRIDRPGRVAAFEVMICTPAIQHMIRDHKTYSIYSAIQTGQQWGMCTLDSFLLSLYRKGIIDKDEMMRIADRPEEIAEKLGETEVHRAADVHATTVQTTAQSVQGPRPPSERGG